MRKINSLIGSVFLIFTVLACNFIAPQSTPLAPAPQPQNNTFLQSEDDVPRINVSDAKAALDSGAAVIVDVRSVEAFAATRVAGAISIPLQNFEGSGVLNPSLEKDHWIITYCT